MTLVGLPLAIRGADSESQNTLVCLRVPSDHDALRLMRSDDCSKSEVMPVTPLNLESSKMKSVVTFRGTIDGHGVSSSLIVSHHSKHHSVIEQSV
eukprot:2123780-Rhodomonas_salina.2